MKTWDYGENVLVLDEYDYDPLTRYAWQTAIILPVGEALPAQPVRRCAVFRTYDVVEISQMYERMGVQLVGAYGGGGFDPQARVNDEEMDISVLGRKR